MVQQNFIKFVLFIISVGSDMFFIYTDIQTNKEKMESIRFKDRYLHRRRDYNWQIICSLLKLIKLWEF